MTLQPNTIDPDAVVLEELDVGTCAVGLVADGLDVVVVVVELDAWVGGGGGGPERDLDVLWSEDREEGVVAVGAVFVEGFVHVIPGVALAGPVAGFVGYVVDEGFSEILFCPGVGIN